MNIALQILGSIASIVSIPLAIYIYLRSREARYNKLKLEIVKILSYQIGEGRNLSLFEINSVIDSKTKETNFKLNSIYPMDIIKDLVTETTSSPMLGSNRKKEIITNLKSIYEQGEIKTSKFLNDKSIEVVSDNRFSIKSNVYGFSVIGAFVFGIVLSYITNHYNIEPLKTWFQENILIKILLSLTVTIIALLIPMVFNKGSKVRKN